MLVSCRPGEYELYRSRRNEANNLFGLTEKYKNEAEQYKTEADKLSELAERYGKETAALKEKTGAVTAELDLTRVELDLTRKSFSYRLGRFLTFVPRKIRGMFGRK